MALGLPFGSLSASADEEKPAATPAPEGQTVSEIHVQTLTVPLRTDTGNYYEIIEGFEGGWPGPWTVFDGNGTANGEYLWGPSPCEPHTGSYKGWPARYGLNGYPSHTSGCGARYAYPNNLASWMVSPPIDLTNAVAGDVSFWMLLDTELNFDYCGVYASRDSTNFWGSRTSGNTGGYSYYDYDIANWPGLGSLLGDSSVWFAWGCTSDASITRSAMYVDDIELQVTLACDAFGDPRATCYPSISMPFDRTNWPARWAIDEALDPDLSCTGPYFDSIWYHFQAPYTGTAWLHTLNSDYDTVLGVFSGGSPGTERACNDDTRGTTRSEVTLPVTGGVWYHVLVGTFDSGVGGTLRLHGEMLCTADVGIDGQGILSPPSSIPVNQNVNLTLRKTLHNNGPNGPATVNISTQLTGPGDCTATPPSLPSPSLPVSVNVTVDEVWTVRCSQASTHTFTFNNSIAVGAGCTDPVPGNNSASTQLTTAVTASADVAIASQGFVNPPSEIQCDQNVQVTLRKDIVNNGPYSPVDVNISTQGLAPTGCTITPPASVAPQKVDVAANAAVDEVWTIRCSQEGSKTFTLNNAISVTTAHVTDPNSGNNTRSTQLTVTVACRPADVKIMSQTVNPPSGTQVPVGQPLTVRLSKTLHNNGPYGPVAVSISASASAPSGSSATPSPNNPTSANLPVSVSQTVVEEWTVNCGVAGQNTFTFNNRIDVTTPGVTDPNTANNASQTQATYTCDGGDPAIVRIGSGNCTPGGDCTVPLDAQLPSPKLLGAFTVDIVYQSGLTPQAWNSTGSPMDMVQCVLNYAANTVRCTGISAAGQGGNVRLANLTFRCAAGMTGCRDLQVSVVTFADPNGQPIIPVQPEHGRICVGCECGDVNGSDGANPVDSVDCLFILQNVVGQKQCSTQCPPPAGTLNCPAANVDGQDGVTSIDALFCLQYVVGIRPPPLTCAPLP
jgi:hypothetical protein